ncbi:MAG: hypothetical protein QM648_05465 [Solirubrobacterales bacterium]
MRGYGRAVFVAILLLIAGVVNIFYGFGAVSDSHFWVGESHFVFGNLHTWGWITVLLGIVQLIAGFSLFGGGGFGRFIGIVAASLGAIGALFAIGGAYPLWSICVFALCVICLHGLIVLGEPIED